MPIKSTKPAPGNFSPGTKPKPLLSHFKTEEQLAARVGQARTQVNAFNSRILAMTQPYSRAAELRAGNQFRLQQEAAIRAENVGAPPPRRLQNRLGLARPIAGEN